MEDYYYDCKLNQAFSIGGQTLASQPMDFMKVYVIKIYALVSRKLFRETTEFRHKLLFEHLMLGRHFLERPEGPQDRRSCLTYAR